MLMELAEILLWNAGKPKNKAEDAKTEALLEDFCRQCAIFVLACEQKSANT